MYGDSHAPDGMDETQINALIAEAWAEWSQAPLPTAALLDGSALERRLRREERRRLNALVRELPRVRPMSDETGTEAA